MPTELHLQMLKYNHPLGSSVRVFLCAFTDAISIFVSQDEEDEMNSRAGPNESSSHDTEQKTTATALTKTLIAWTLSVLATIAAAVVIKVLGL